MFSEVNVTVEDGNLGRNTSTASHAQVKIGVSGTESSVPLLITNSMKPGEIQAKLGYSPLADACIDAAENGLKTIYAIPMAADVKGELGEVTHTGTGTGKVSVTGDPGNAYDLVVRITDTGKVNEGSFQYSIDGGNSFSDEYTIPITGKHEVEGTGLTLKFEDDGGTGESFVEGDAYAASTTAPTMNNASVLKAVDALKNYNKTFEICHIVGVSAKTLWAALASEAEEFLETYKKPLIFLCEGRQMQDGESIDEYLAAMEKERKGINTLFLCVCLTYATYTRKDLRTQNINVAGILSGMLGGTKESMSVGYVEDFAISSAKLAQMLPDGIEAYSRQLDEMGYTVLRQYTGKDDYYVSNANVLAPEGSDYPYVENVRVLNRIIREVSKRATNKLQCEIDPNNLEASVAAIESYLGVAVDDCLEDTIISSGEVEIDTENLDILADETLNVSVTWVPMGSARVFNLTFAVSNPATSAGE